MRIHNLLIRAGAGIIVLAAVATVYNLVVVAQGGAADGAVAGARDEAVDALRAMDGLPAGIALHFQAEGYVPERYFFEMTPAQFEAVGSIEKEFQLARSSAQLAAADSAARRSGFAAAGYAGGLGCLMTGTVLRRRYNTPRAVSVTPDQEAYPAGE